MAPITRHSKRILVMQDKGNVLNLDKKDFVDKISSSPSKSIVKMRRGRQPQIEKENLPLRLSVNKCRSNKSANSLKKAVDAKINVLSKSLKTVVNTSNCLQEHSPKLVLSENAANNLVTPVNKSNNNFKDSSLVPADEHCYHVKPEFLKPLRTVPVWKQMFKSRVSPRIVKANGRKSDIYDIATDADLMADTGTFVKRKKRNMNVKRPMSKSSVKKVSKKTSNVPKIPYQSKVTAHSNNIPQPTSNLVHINKDFQSEATDKCITLSVVGSLPVPNTNDENMFGYDQHAKEENEININEERFFQGGISSICEDLISSFGEVNNRNSILIPEVTTHINNIPQPASNLVHDNKNFQSETNKQKNNILVPKMASTPENTSPHSPDMLLTCAKSFNMRMSEISLIPCIPGNVCNEVQVDLYDEDILFPSNKINDINLFESPQKESALKENVHLEDTVRKSLSKIFSRADSQSFSEEDVSKLGNSKSVVEQEKLITEKCNTLNNFDNDGYKYTSELLDSEDFCCYSQSKPLVSAENLHNFSEPVEKCNGNSKLNSVHDTFHNFDAEELTVKSRKSYDNPKQFARNISRVKKALPKKKSAKQIQQESLMDSMNMHFSDIESMELSVETLK